MQSAVPEFDGPKPGSEVKAEIHDVRRDKTKVSQSAGLSGTMEVERTRHRCIGAIAGKPQEHQAVQSAVSEFDGLKLGNEVESEANDVRRDKAKFDQSAGLLGTVEIERLRYAADQAARIQARPTSPIPSATGLDADLAATRVPESSMCGTPDLYEEMNLVHTVNVSDDMRIRRPVDSSRECERWRG